MTPTQYTHSRVTPIRGCPWNEGEAELAFVLIYSFQAPSPPYSPPTASPLELQLSEGPSDIVHIPGAPFWLVHLEEREVEEH